MSCLICFSTTRPVKYQTARVRICQWCVSVLINTKVRPQQILATVAEEFTAREWRGFLHSLRQMGPRPQPPLSPADRRGEIAAQCERQVLLQEGFLTSLVRALFNSNQRTRAIAAAVATGMGRAQVEYQARLREHHRQLADFDAKQAAREQEQQEFEARLPKAAYDSIEQYLSDKVNFSPQSSAADKVTRAFARGLIAKGHEPEGRAPEELAKVVQLTVMRADGFKCAICSSGGATVELHVHHIIPLSKLGTNQHANLVTLCYGCHNRQHDGFRVTRQRPARSSRASSGASRVLAPRHPQALVNDSDASREVVRSVTPPPVQWTRFWCGACGRPRDLLVSDEPTMFDICPRCGSETLHETGR